MHITTEKLKNVLKEAGLLENINFETIKEEAERSELSIPSILISRGLATEDFIAEIFEPYFGAQSIDLKKISIPQETLEAVSEGFAKSKGVILFEYDKEKSFAKVAMTDPLDFETIEFLRAKLHAWVEPHLMTQTNLRYGLKQYKRQLGMEFNKIISENIKKSLSLVGERQVAKLAEAIPIVTILDSIIEHAVSLGSSDIHFEPLASEVLVRFRIDGIMHEILTLPKLIAPLLVARVKVLCSLLIDEHRVPQDGRFAFELEDSSMDVRVNVMPVFHGEKVEMRLLRRTAMTIRLADLGLSPENEKIILEEIKKPHGMVLSTGPTGHGKTTTLYTVLHLLNTPRVNITTIEDPIEYEVPRVNQTQVNTKAGITFANGLRSLLRQNPDIIMVGEIRDNETVDIAIHAALTGHLVLSTLHTNDAPSAVARFIDMGAQPFLLASTLNVVIAQRLVRKICTFCIESFSLNAETKRVIERQASFAGLKRAMRTPTRAFRGKGCKICNQSGFRGQTGIFEVMRITEPLRSFMLKTVPTGEIRKQAIKDGMRTLFEDGLQKIQKGVTTVEEVVRVVQE